MARDANGFTPTQAAIYHVLADGKWHSRKELEAVIDDDRDVLRNHINRMRKIIEPQGLKIIYENSNTAGIGLQIVRRLMPMSNG